MNGHELEHWLAESRTELAAPHISTDLSRGPTVGSGRGATWLSFESKRSLGRVVLSAGGHCDLTVTSRADGRKWLDEHCEIATPADLDGPLASLVTHLL